MLLLLLLLGLVDGEGAMTHSDAISCRVWGIGLRGGR